MTKGAIFSDDRTFRYVLFRIWNDQLPKVAFIGLNPSTANETEPDNTITKVKKIAEHNGFGGFYMLNLFGLVSKNPDDLLTCDDPVRLNDSFLKEYSKNVEAIIFCWGAFKQSKIRAEAVKKMFPEALCIKHTKDGSPWHPLYCLDESVLIPYNK